MNNIEWFNSFVEKVFLEAKSTGSGNKETILQALTFDFNDSNKIFINKFISSLIDEVNLDYLSVPPYKFFKGSKDSFINYIKPNYECDIDGDLPFNKEVYNSFCDLIYYYRLAYALKEAIKIGNSISELNKLKTLQQGASTIRKVRKVTFKFVKINGKLEKMPYEETCTEQEQDNTKAIIFLLSKTAEKEQEANSDLAKIHNILIRPTQEWD